MNTSSSLRIVLDDSLGKEPSRKLEVLTSLLENGQAVTVGGGHVAPLDDSTLLVLEETGTPRNEDTEDAEAGVAIQVRDITDLDADQVAALARDDSADPAAFWKPWFPVIDYDRCTNCMQCLSFCLFGVYDVDEDKTIDVAQPQRCKTNCPACSRVCPEVAILFPKYRNGPINGDEVKAEDISREKMKTDISSLLGGDIYSLLRQRHKRATSRFSKERDEDRALKERQKCLAALKENLDIPDEVLAELPTAEAIQAKAAARISDTGTPSDDDNDPTRN